MRSSQKRGAHDRFHFFGVKLGAVKSNVMVKDISFTLRLGNILFGNIIRGSQYAEIFLVQARQETSFSTI